MPLIYSITQLSSLYASIMLNAFRHPLCSKLCQHNRPVPTFPSATTNAARLSIEVYCRDDKSVSIPSLILKPSGENRSTVSLHFHSLFLRPKGFRWTPLGLLPTGSFHILCRATSLLKYSVTFLGLSHWRFKLAD